MCRLNESRATLHSAGHPAVVGLLFLQASNPGCPVHALGSGPCPPQTFTCPRRLPSHSKDSLGSSCGLAVLGTLYEQNRATRGIEVSGFAAKTQRELGQTPGWWAPPGWWRGRTWGARLRRGPCDGPVLALYRGAGERSGRVCTCLTHSSSCTLVSEQTKSFKMSIQLFKHACSVVDF